MNPSSALNMKWNSILFRVTTEEQFDDKPESSLVAATRSHSNKDKVLHSISNKDTGAAAQSQSEKDL
ncbi:hypothetical protein ACFX15_038052 [Malus domestica]